MEHNVVVHVLWAVIADKAHEADLVVDDQQCSLGPVDPLKLVCSN